MVVNSPKATGSKTRFLEKIYLLARRRYTSSRREDILIWKVSNTAMGMFVQINGKVCAHLWPSICTYVIGGLERGCSGFP